MTLHPSLPLDAVLFDYGMVLSGPANPVVWARMLDISGLSQEQFHSGYWAPRHAYDRGTHTGEAYFQLIAQAHGKTFTPEQIAALIAADTELWTDLNPPMVAWADALQRAGIRTGILSNLGDAMAAGVLGKFPWLGAFHHCTWSHTVKLAKPEAAVYRHAAEGLGAAPERTLFIDDRADNIEGARSYGMQAIQYIDHGLFVSEMEARGYGALLDPAAIVVDVRSAHQSNVR